jgi:hypothetical protein
MNDLPLILLALLMVAGLISFGVVVAQLWLNWSAAETDWGDE